MKELGEPYDVQNPVGRPGERKGDDSMKGSTETNQTLPKSKDFASKLIADLQ
jgi:hypothetical protein